MAIFITKGSRLTIPEGGMFFGVNKDGVPDFKINEVHVNVDQSPHWLDISYTHMLKSQSARKLILEKKENLERDEIGELLNQECSHGMQAIVSAAISLDAFYSTVIENTDIKKEENNRGTKRWAQIAELLKKAFKLNQNQLQQLRSMLKNLFEVRDLAVHPNAKSRKPVLDEDLEVGVEWRYAAFSAANSKNAFQNTLSIIGQLLKKGRSETVPASDMSTKSHALYNEIIKKWENEFGKLW